jgi:hypothetical protein
LRPSKEVIAKHPSTPAALIALSNLYALAGQYKEAITTNMEMLDKFNQLNIHSALVEFHRNSELELDNGSAKLHSSQRYEISL